MKKSKLIRAVAFAVLIQGLTSCLDANKDYYDNVEPVRPGIYIYNAAFSQNQAAMQPADIALRLAILRAEAEKQGKVDDMADITVDGQNVKTLLFGLNTRISQDESEAGTYVIEYRNSGGQAPYDIFLRTGSVRVKTQGVALEQSDASNRWSVSLESAELTVKGGSPVKITSTGDMYVYCQGDAYAMGFAKALSETDTRTADWSGTFTLRTDKNNGLSFSALEDASFELEGTARGTSFWSFNGLSGAGMSYSVSAGKYQPSRTGFSSQIMGGTEECGLTSPLDYDVADYPSPDVKVSWSVNGNMLTYALTYDGTTVNF